MGDKDAYRLPEQFLVPAITEAVSLLVISIVRPQHCMSVVGLSGTHLLRLNCRPELSLITLRTQPLGAESI